jgi:mono/diheme cytochrome c family protein
MRGPSERRSGTSLRALGLLLVLGCGEPADASEAGGPTGAECPPDSTLTYATFAQSFMSSYCTQCHTSGAHGSARNGAPSGHDFDTLAGLRATPAEHIDEQAAAGPEHVNTAMPPSSPRPPTLERERLGEWLACGMP